MMAIWPSVWTFVLAVQLLAIAMIDQRWQIIPDYLNAMLGLIGLTYVYDGSWQTVFYAALTVHLRYSPSGF